MSKRLLNVAFRHTWVRFLVGGLVVTGCLVLVALAFRNRSERHQVRDVYAAFQRALQSGDYAAAYAYMTPEYRSRNPLTEFKYVFGDLAEPRYGIGPTVGVKVRGHAAEVCPTARPGMFGSRKFLGSVLRLSKTNGVWMFTGELRLYLD